MSRQCSPEGPVCSLARLVLLPLPLLPLLIADGPACVTGVLGSMDSELVNAR